MRIPATLASISALGLVLACGQERYAPATPENQQLKITEVAGVVTVRTPARLLVNSNGNTEATVTWSHPPKGELVCRYGGSAGEFTFTPLNPQDKRQKCEPGTGRNEEIVFYSGDQTLVSIPVAFQAGKQETRWDDYALYATIAAALAALLSVVQAVWIPRKIRTVQETQMKQFRDAALSQTKKLQTTLSELTRPSGAAAIVEERVSSKADLRIDTKRFFSAVDKWSAAAGKLITVVEACGRIRAREHNSSPSAEADIRSEAETVAIVTVRRSDLAIDPDKSSDKIQEPLKELVDCVGLTFIDPARNTAVDPNLHEPTKVTNASGSGRKRIAEVTVRGLQSGDRVIEKAKVALD